MKQEYIDQLRSLLNEYKMEDSEKTDILSDYSEMYDNYADLGMSEQEIEHKLGSPDSIIADLTEGYRRKGEPADTSDVKGARGKIIALSPFIALILFFVGGFVFNGWAYSWTAFLLIPVTAIIASMAGKDKHILTAISPFVAVIAYLVLGFSYNLWHPGWLVFLIIPVIAILTEARTMKLFELLTALSPFAAVAVFFLYFGENDMWNPGWLIFLIVPAIGVLNEKNILKLLLWEVLIIGAAIGYLLIWDATGDFWLSMTAFIPLVAYSFFQPENGIWHMPRNYKIVVLAAIAAYVLLGLLLNLWGYAWLVFLAIPVYAIQTETDNNAKLIATTPFIAVVIFYTLGYFFGWWAFSWLAFLLIPIVAIIKEA